MCTRYHDNTKFAMLSKQNSTVVCQTLSTSCPNLRRYKVWASSVMDINWVFSEDVVVLDVIVKGINWVFSEHVVVLDVIVKGVNWGVQ